MNYFSGTNDNELFAQVQQGNTQAFEALYNRYWKNLFNEAYKRVHSQEKSEEILQELFMDLWKGKERIEIKTNLQGYLHKALKYKVFNQIKKDIVREEYLDYATKNQSNASNPIQDILFFKELSNFIDVKIDALPDKCREVFILNFKQHLDTKEIASKLNISPNTVIKHKLKAFKLLREGLKNYETFMVAIPIIHFLGLIG